jgi:hypothetical protein
LVTIGYNCDGGEKVRAFALDVTVNKTAYWVGTARRASPEYYYVTPTSMTFKIVDGNTVVDKYGSPMVSETTSGGIIELASLYATNDPCAAHKTTPPSSGTLVTFRVNCAKSLGGAVTVALAKNTARGGVVLEDPAVTPTVNLPATFTVCACSYPACWDWTRQCHGDADNSTKVKGPDFMILQTAWNAVYPAVLYNPCADFDKNGKVKGSDFMILQTYWNLTPPPDCVLGEGSPKIYCP